MKAKTQVISVLVTTHNRPVQLQSCLIALAETGGNFDFRVQIVNSGKAIKFQFPERLKHVKILNVSNDYFWAKSMDAGAKAILERGEPKTVLWLNEDVRLTKDSLTKMFSTMKKKHADVVVGQCFNRLNEITYGGFNQNAGLRRLHFTRVIARKHPEAAATFNGNIVLLDKWAIKEIGLFMRGYEHGLADIAYGLEASKRRAQIVVAPGISGYCELNTTKNVCFDTSKPRSQRIRSLLKPQGVPPGPQLRLAIKYGGAFGLVYFFSTYARFLITLCKFERKEISHGYAKSKIERSLHEKS